MTVELEHFLARCVNVIRDEHTQSPGLGIPTTREELTAGVFKLLQPGERVDESSEHSSIGAIEIRCIALEGRPHVFAGRRKESRVVDETIQKRVDCLQRHPGTVLVVMRRNLSPTGCARKVTDP